MHSNYISPFSTRYSSDQMQYLFSEDFKFRTWRKLWIALAKGEKSLGLNITDSQITELEQYKDNINYDDAVAREKLVRHDVMSHIHAYGLQAKTAAGIIHLGATSCYVGDNTDVIIMKEALQHIKAGLVSTISALAAFAEKYKSLPCLGYTHLQPAQITTVGKRATLWLNELLYDFNRLVFEEKALKLRGCKGTTGTQASFLELFEGDEEKVKSLEKFIAKEVGFDENATVPVCGQTYSRKVDYNILTVLSGIAQSASKFANDLRLLASFKEMEEPFEKNQIGSSAMPYKRNPMRSERICALARFVETLTINPALTASTQWFERTLDDSANKRLSVAESFLATDAILLIMQNVCSGLVVYPKVIESRLMAEIPFMASENIMMAAVKKGGNRQELHEKIRTHAVAAASVVKNEGGQNDLIKRIAADADFNITESEILAILKPENFVGRSPSQVTEFLQDYVKPVLTENKALITQTANLKV
jgi:adenylosuccinate lyase